MQHRETVECTVYRVKAVCRKTCSSKRQVFDSSEKATEKAVFRRYKPQSSRVSFGIKIAESADTIMQQAAEQPPNRSNAVKNKVQKYRMMQEESEMTETNTSGIITAAADIVAGAFNALPKRVCNQHKFSDYADYLHENLPAQAELDLQREKPLNPAPLVSVAIACSGASRAAVRSARQTNLCKF